MKKQVYGTKEKTEHLETLLKCKKWYETTGENRSRLKEFMNSEFVPLITTPYPHTPVIHLIPPPPLYLIVLGNAVKITYFT